MPTWVMEDQATVRAPLYPLGSITAAAQRLAAKPSESRPRTNMPKPQDWQAEAWDMFDLVGEYHFLATTLANRIGSGTLYVGEVEPDTPTAEPVQSENAAAQAALSAFGGNQAGRSQIIRRMALNLLVAGEGWFLGVDADTLTAAVEAAEPTYAPGGPSTPIPLPDKDGQGMDPARMEWRSLSVSEITSPRNDNSIDVALEDGTRVTAKIDDVALIRVWRPHPRRAWEADSPVKAGLPVLREIVGLTMQVAAQVDSRLAGAGLFWVREGVLRSLRIGARMPPDAADNPLLESLMKTMMEPIRDRDVASAVVPLILPIPDEIADPVGYVTFATPLDAQIPTLRDGAIRRFALGQDAPPEILLGGGSMNHWGLWLTAEETVTVHIEPPLALICDAITTQYLWPALIAGGMSEDEAQRFVVWYSVEHMVTRPNAFEEAKYLYEAGEVDGDTLRRTAGYDESDEPGAGEERARTVTLGEAEAEQVAIAMALDMLRKDPGLASAPGVVKLAADLVKLLTADLEQPEPPAMAEGGDGPPVEDEPPAGEVPTEPTTDGPPRMAASAGGP